jgi:hypothetical protein
MEERMDCINVWAKKAKMAPVAAAGRSGADIQGRLDDGCILDVVQLLVRTAKSGRLELHPEGIGAQTFPCAVFLHRGNIVHAEHGENGGYDALWKALKITKGEFSFFAGHQPGTTTIRENPMTLLLEACRRQDEEAIALR